MEKRFNLGVMNCIAVCNVCVFALCAGYPAVRNIIRRILCRTHAVMSHTLQTVQ